MDGCTKFKCSTSTWSTNYYFPPFSKKQRLLFSTSYAYILESWWLYKDQVIPRPMSFGSLIGPKIDNSRNMGMIALIKLCINTTEIPMEMETCFWEDDEL